MKREYTEMHIMMPGTQGLRKCEVLGPQPPLLPVLRLTCFPVHQKKKKKEKQTPPYDYIVPADIFAQITFGLINILGNIR